jgi:hypothetical protein
MSIDGFSLKGCTPQRKNGLLEQASSVACCCRGPQNGQPVCPCQMRSVQIVNGRYVRVTDLGPAPAAPRSKVEPRFYGTD